MASSRSQNIAASASSSSYVGQQSRARQGLSTTPSDTHPAVEQHGYAMERTPSRNTLSSRTRGSFHKRTNAVTDAGQGIQQELATRVAMRETARVWLNRYVRQTPTLSMVTGRETPSLELKRWARAYGESARPMGRDISHLIGKPRLDTQHQTISSEGRASESVDRKSVV